MVEVGVSQLIGGGDGRGVQVLTNSQICAKLFLKFANLIWNCDYKRQIKP